MSGRRVFNFNLGVGWASSGVEYAQVYRAKMFRSIGVEAKFIFTNMFPKENIQHMTEHIGFLDSEVEWLYTFFTDTGISPVTYTLDMLEQTFETKNFIVRRKGKTVNYIFSGSGNYCRVYLVEENSSRVHRVELVSDGSLVRKDYFTYCRIYSEYYVSRNNKPQLYLRRFFNEDGSVAYEELVDNASSSYRFPDKVLHSKAELAGYLVSRLNLTSEDVILIDRAKDMGPAILENAGPAKTGVVIHADHFYENSTDETRILWSHYYEYLFSQHEKISFYIVSTDAQNRLLREQFKKHIGVEPRVVTIPAGSIEQLKYPEQGRRKYSLITASRLAKEKHIDWLVEAVALAKQKLPDITLDIYGSGAEEESIRELVEQLDVSDCIKLCGQQELAEVYQNYEAYASASISEGFGLSLMEAAGAGLPILGFDVRYGNWNFIDQGKNGYKIPVNSRRDTKENVIKLASAIVGLFSRTDLDDFHQHSYEKAEKYLTARVEERWRMLLK